MWEWSHGQSVQGVRPPGVFGKVNRVRFTAQGNKFGACDGDGTVALWQTSNCTSPYFVSGRKGGNKRTMFTFSLFISESPVPQQTDERLCVPRRLLVSVLHGRTWRGREERRSLGYASHTEEMSGEK